MKKRQQKKMKMFGGVALATFALALILMVVGFSNTVSDISGEVISKTPDAILASAGVIDKSEISLPVIYYDQRADECVNLYDTNLRHVLFSRQFEWSSCEYNNKQIEKGLVEYELDKDYLPVGVAGRMTSNRGVSDNKRWFSEVEGKSKSYAGMLKMSYHSNGAEFLFVKDDFYPLDEAEFSNGDFVNKDGHNHLFTMNFALPFMVLRSGDERFEIAADDDTFVFLGNKLVIDMGGIHDVTNGRFEIRDNGEVYAGVNDEEMAFTGVTLEKDTGSIVRIFHADRDAASSSLRLQFNDMKLNIENTEVAAGSKDMGLQVAYDPSDPSYVAPLGRSMVVRPDATKGNIVLATVEGALVVIFAVLLMFAIKFVVKTKLVK